MKVIHGINRIKKFHKAVAALGVFDGVHRGHRVILKAAVDKARRIGGKSVAVTFYPHPQKEKSLYSLAHRLKLIASLGVDACVVINFNARFAKISAEDFIKDILINRLSARYIYVGENFRFGKNAAGDCEMLKRLAKILGFKLKLFRVVKAGGRPISSTAIRSLIRAGNLFAAERLLTRPVSVLGTVIRGESLAKKLGFPTANINPHHEVIPASGVYAVEALLGKEKFNGVCNIGNKPTFNPAKETDPHVELHIFNFKKNIYGKDVEILFIKKIRAEKKFAAAVMLIEQIKKDIKSAKALFPRH